ncbi:MAG: DUF4912 domain-containing protein [Pyrinomonadaceae bacterium]
MKTKVTKNKVTKAVAADPFESLAEPTPVAKASTLKAPAKAPAVAKPAKRLLSTTPKEDAFDTTVLEAVSVATSPVKKRTASAKKPVKAAAATKKPAAKKSKVNAAGIDVTAEIAAPQPEVEASLTFKALAEPVLPALEKENRARLLMQSPTKLFFYWSVKENPYQLLRDAFGTEIGSYTLVLKLTDVASGVETMHQTEAAGESWFDVEPDTEYQAEIGFYAPNRPYFRIVYSNTVTTPRRSPSAHAATEAGWTVSATKFAEVLDVSGFTHDAFDVAMAGDDKKASDDATFRAFTALTGSKASALSGISAEEMRLAMVALAAGQVLEELRFQISRDLFAVLQANSGGLKASKARTALSQHFDIDDSDLTEEKFGPAVFGASLVNFPRTLKTRTDRRFTPLSSSTLRA